MIAVCSFRLSHYRDCLATARDAGYKFHTMGEFVSSGEQPPETGKLMLMRHDIDHYLPLAANFSRIEQQLGVRSTYFIRMHARYNPASYENYGVIREILSAGHEIGLHYEGDFPALFGEDREEGFRRDRRALEAITGNPIQGISSHEPNKSSKAISDSELSRLGLSYQAYSPRFLSGMKYISDSSSRWREGCMCEFIERGVPRLCILTHPLWWFERSPVENY